MEEKEKTVAQQRREALLNQPKNGYDRLSAEDEAAMRTYCEEYKRFLDAGKTKIEVTNYDKDAPPARPSEKWWTRWSAWPRARALCPLSGAWR